MTRVVRMLDRSMSKVLPPFEVFLKGAVTGESACAESDHRPQFMVCTFRPDGPVRIFPSDSASLSLRILIP